MLRRAIYNSGSRLLDAYDHPHNKLNKYVTGLNMILHKMEKIRLQIEDFFNTADIRNNKKNELALLCALVKSSLQDGNLGDQNHTLQALRFMALNRPEQTRHNTGNFLWELEKTLRTDLQCFSREKGGGFGGVSRQSGCAV